MQTSVILFYNRPCHYRHFYHIVGHSTWLDQENNIRLDTLSDTVQENSMTDNERLGGSLRAWSPGLNNTSVDTWKYTKVVRKLMDSKLAKIDNHLKQIRNIVILHHY